MSDELQGRPIACLTGIRALTSWPSRKPDDIPALHAELIALLAG